MNWSKIVKTTAVGSIVLMTSAVMAANDDVTSKIIGAEGDAIGSVTLQQGSGGVLMTVELDNGALTSGWHGIHFHAHGTCDDVGEFKLSGGHVGKKPGAHGLLNPEGPEFGDLPNIFVPEGSDAKAQFFAVGLTLAPSSDGEALLDADGSALVIHAQLDDHITQPIGGAGGRVACAVLQ